MGNNNWVVFKMQIKPKTLIDFLVKQAEIKRKLYNPKLEYYKKYGIIIKDTKRETS